MPISFQFPNVTNLAKGTAVHLAFKFGMQTAKPFKVSDSVGNEGSPNFNEIEDLLGQRRLTTLAVKYGDKTIEIEECILSVSQEKNIVTTPLQGRDGTIKEFISDGDYNITAEIAVSNYNQIGGDENDQSAFDYPKEKLKALVSFLKLKDTIDVDSDFLKFFGIESAVVQSYNLVQETHSNRQSLQIQLLSDVPYEIKIANK
ncbi:DUF6046 domain-containing protein [Tenacibaculum piscium]|uniref:DUF6046 domain-containing protein n=1 Tax=Tenacibaculum piscium TaxID=1458515 RepID=UPI001F25F8DA|nr:DUF6046 domain-containing protein [Tenacibaculum piscium]